MFMKIPVTAPAAQIQAETHENPRSLFQNNSGSRCKSLR
jgi:hypothetical protein